MPYLVDGHNLIPKAGLQLESADDEMQLVALLQEFGRHSRKDIEVYFDGAPTGSSGSRRYGRVTAHFVSSRSTADAAIKRRLRELGGEARNWVIVSSDRQVTTAAHASRARTERSESFARKLGPQAAVRLRDGERKSPERDVALSDQDLKRWLELFKRR
ncbi:MAG TPA: NYN domain-containing protein [Anaerolineales bacterium]